MGICVIKGIWHLLWECLLSKVFFQEVLFILKVIKQYVLVNKEKSTARVSKSLSLFWQKNSNAFRERLSFVCENMEPFTTSKANMPRMNFGFIVWIAMVFSFFHIKKKGARPACPPFSLTGGLLRHRFWRCRRRRPADRWCRPCSRDGFWWSSRCHRGPHW